MKIYPSKSQIEYTDKVDSNMDIPLAYINSDYIEKTITININKSSILFPLLYPHS